MTTMKKNLQYLFLLLFVVAIGGVLPSCSNQVGYIWDFSSRKIEIEIVDEEGTPLIEPTTHWGDERLKSIQFTFEGESFYYQGLPAQVLRARPEAYRNVGIQREKRSYVLTFGEFQPKYVKSEIEINIPNVGKHSIQFTFDANPIGRNPNITQRLWVDGKQQDAKERFRVRLVVDRKKWESYTPSSGYTSEHLPVTLYFAGAIPPINTTSPQNTFVIYNGKKLGIEKEYKGDPIYSKSLVFTHGRSAFISSEEGGVVLPFYSFGPFDPAKQYENEKFTLCVMGNNYNIEFTAKLGKDGKSVFSAKLLDAQGSQQVDKKVYFRNGPLIFLSR